MPSITRLQLFANLFGFPTSHGNFEDKVPWRQLRFAHANIPNDYDIAVPVASFFRLLVVHIKTSLKQVCGILQWWKKACLGVQIVLCSKLANTQLEDSVSNKNTS